MNPFHVWPQAGIAAALLVLGCHREPAAKSSPALPPVGVRIGEVAARGEPVSEEVVGTVQSRLRTMVEAKVAGRLEAVRVAPGQRVRRGDELARLESRELVARREQSLAVREQADRDLERTSQLVRDGAATAAELDAARLRQRVAAAAEAEAETLLGHARVEAPFDAVVTRKLAEVGDLAIPGRPLFELEDPDKLRFEADVPEALIDRVPMGTRLSIRIAALPSSVEGVVSEVAPAADPSTRTYAVRLDLPAMPGLRLGQFGRVTVPTGPASGVHVPKTAVVQRGQLEFVYVIQDATAHLRLVRTGRRTSNAVELVAGASLGEKVAVSGAERLHDGQRVSEQ